jgi:predicted transcriptional regulator
MIVFYPIKPVYIKRILTGEKKLELRKRLPKPETKYVVLYSTYPIGLVVGYAEVRSMHKSPVGKLWKSVAKDAGISRGAYFEYFGDNENACAIEFYKVFSFIRPFKVKEIRQSFTVPQSFCYLDKEIFNRLKRRKKVLV